MSLQIDFINQFNINILLNMERDQKIESSFNSGKQNLADTLNQPQLTFGQSVTMLIQKNEIHLSIFSYLDNEASEIGFEYSGNTIIASNETNSENHQNESNSVTQINQNLFNDPYLMFDRYIEMDNQIDSQNHNFNQFLPISLQDSSLSKLKVERVHLTLPRRKRGEKTDIQQTVDGYWTKNFLQFGKKPHLKQLETLEDFDIFLQINPSIRTIYKKNGITMKDYLVLYKHQDLQQLWQQFFLKKKLYRALIFSRVQIQFQNIFIQFIFRFEQAFISKEFDHIVKRPQKINKSN